MTSTPTPLLNSYSPSIPGRAKVIVVGGGVMGASAAWNLAKAGAAVTLVESDPDSRSTATASSFGWVGASASNPSDNPAAFALRLKALEAFAALEGQLGPLPIATRGALLWLSNEEETAAMIAEHQSAGTRMERLLRAQISDKEPMLAEAPPLAAWAPDDFALEPAAFARQLLAGAQDFGASILQGTVDAVEVTGSRVSGLSVGGQRLTADTVVLANGLGAQALASTAGVHLPIHPSPAVVLRFRTEAHGLRHLLCADDMELRPSLGGGLVSTADYPANAESGFPGLAARSADAIAHLLGLTVAPALISIAAAQRPMTTDGEPLCAYVGEIDGLFALVAHPGVILAPFLGQLCATSVLGRC
ncbi:FAD-binding oxidoreductase [Comamonas sp. JUb58]|uniref:NAD(P)/FAD-dependent oxidoreductase n=1 Tax=Comamonas sp. JUb58 TaxID=2485114 RepID=UPI00105DE420|nr:FAD-binding oxidoreductase [Comamonas sp. JUb58]TDS82202.1 glycine/D-amino acid oxidase-like deaminating enzyme [Comamonas sp. JUb58]